MVIGIKAVLFLIAAIIFGLAVVLGFAGEPYTVWGGRAHSLAFCLMATAFFLWAGGK